MRWSLFCRVIDNYGDAGFCLRLARELQARGEQVDLFIDDPSPLAWMQAGDPNPVIAQPWPAEQAPPLGEVVIEAFGCELPDAVQAAIAVSPRPPRWINLEYLSAETYVERSHGLPSPVMSGPAHGQVKRFCYPGFTPATGGLLIERTLSAQQAAHRSTDWLRAQGLPADTRRRVSLFCYPGAPLPALFEALADQPTLVFVCGDPVLPPPPPGVHLHRLPLLSQAAYDRLLWSCDLNLVRGEDSFVRAQLAGRPLLWQLYPQDAAARQAKLDAFLTLYPVPGRARAAWEAWNGFAPASALRSGLVDLAAGASNARDWRDQLLAGVELVTTLQQWAAQAP